MEAGELRVDGSGILERSSSLVVASHELKSPLALLRQLAFELHDDSLSDADKQTIIHQMEVVSEKAMRLTNNITKSASLDQTVFPFEPVNPVEVCEDVIHELHPLYKTLGKSMEITRRTRTPLVIANRDLLRRILLNFGDNALHYSGDDTVMFNIAQVGSEVQVGLRDKGPILAMNENSILGSPGRPESSGLGLEICKTFAEAMNGHVSNIRHHDGMTFYVQLKLSTQMSLL